MSVGGIYPSRREFSTLDSTAYVKQPEINLMSGYPGIQSGSGSVVQPFRVATLEPYTEDLTEAHESAIP
jgi:hypothetical protein